MVDFTKLIPAGGEAEVSARLKGRYGSMKGSRFKKSSRRSGGFAAMRRGYGKKRPQTWLLLPPGPQGSTGNRADQGLMMYDDPGSVDEQSPSSGWLFAITPEGDNGSSGIGTSNVPVLGLGGSISPNLKYRFVGFKGRLYWQPFTPLTDPPEPSGEANTGFLNLYWYKVKAQMPAGGSSQLPQYPWSGGWNDTANTTGNQHTRSFVPNYETQIETSADARRADVRWRTDVIHHVCIPWSIQYMLAPGTWDSTGEYINGAGFVAQPVKPISIPLPRKLICNIGRGEALACAYQVVSGSSVPVSSSPASRFWLADLSVKVFEIDG